MAVPPSVALTVGVEDRRQLYQKENNQILRICFYLIR